MVNHMVEHTPDLSLIFGALADPTRRRILEMLVEGERRVTDLARPFQITLAAVSKHLRVLERAGLLIRRKDGRVHHIRANPETIDEARRWIEEYAAAWDRSFDALDRYLADKHGPPTARARGAAEEEKPRRDRR